MSRRSEKKVCVITGMGGSIDRAAALRFAEEGALVVGCDTYALADVTVQHTRLALRASPYRTSQTGLYPCASAPGGGQSMRGYRAVRRALASARITTGSMPPAKSCQVFFTVTSTGVPTPS